MVMDAFQWPFFSSLLLIGATARFPIMPKRDIQFQPLAPTRLHGKSDEELGTFAKPRSASTGSSKCPVYFLAALVLLAALALIFAFAVLRVGTPDLGLRSVVVKNLRDAASPSPSFNLTLLAEVSLKNKNFGAFKLDHGAARVLYEGMAVAEKNLSRVQVEARDTNRMNITLDVRSERLWDTKNLSSDISSGSLNLTAYAQLTGTVRVMKIVSRQKTAKMNCVMTLNLTNSSVHDVVCR